MLIASAWRSTSWTERRKECTCTHSYGAMGWQGLRRWKYFCTSCVGCTSELYPYPIPQHLHLQYSYMMSSLSFLLRIRLGVHASLSISKQVCICRCWDSESDMLCLYSLPVSLAHNCSRSLNHWLCSDGDTPDQDSHTVVAMWPNFRATKSSPCKLSCAIIIITSEILTLAHESW